MRTGNKYITGVLLVLLFTVSVIVRWPHIGRPLSKHHEFLTAISLRVLTIWEKEGAAKLHYQPRMNYAGSANKHINNHASTTGGMQDSEGNYYYVSHPPFGYMLPYWCLKSFMQPVSVTGIQVFNLACAFVSGLFVFLLLMYLTAGNTLIAVSGYTWYLFSPPVLWFQCNTYMSDILVHLFFCMGIYFFFRSQKNSFGLHDRYTQLLLLAVFFMCYTSWLGYFFGSSLVLYFISIKKLKQQVSFVALIVFAMLLAFASMFLQYSGIAGKDALLAQLSQRLSERGWSGSWRDLPDQYLTILNNLVLNHGVLLAVFFVSGYFFRRKTAQDTVADQLWWVAFLPAVLCYAVLPDYSGHDFTTLYLTPFLVIFPIYQWRYVEFSFSKTISIVSGICLVMVLVYYAENRPGDLSVSGEPYNSGQLFGEYVRSHQRAAVPLFYKGNKPLLPEVIWYAGRNIQQVNNTGEAVDFMQQHGFGEGVLFEWADSDLPSQRIISAKDQ